MALRRSANLEVRHMLCFTLVLSLSLKRRFISVEGTIIEEWSTRLGGLQERSLESWRVQAVEKASQSIQESIRAVSESLTGASWAWEGTYFLDRFRESFAHTHRSSTSRTHQRQRYSSTNTFST